MKKELEIREALESNLELIMENARDLTMIFFKKDDVLSNERVVQMQKFFITASVTLERLRDGLLDGKEQALFDAFMPTCAYLNQQWHKYCKQSLM